MYRRNITSSLYAALGDTRVVLINGARQTGKSTLALQVAAGRDVAYFTLDDPAVLALAESDPIGFLASAGDRPMVIDEVQLCPSLFPALKLSVDRRPTPGRFLLTGSANYLLLPRISESLAGRIEIITLWPLSQGELAGVTEHFVDSVFAGDVALLDPSKEGRPGILGRVLTGGYPEVIERQDLPRRRAWLESYVMTLLQRDLRGIFNVESISAFPRLLNLLATRSASLVNLADISRSLGVPYTTLQRYVGMLEAMFLIQRVQPWWNNLGTRLVKSPKFFLNDTALMAHLMRAEPGQLIATPEMAGSLLETFVVAELHKQIGWSSTRPALYFYRSRAGSEVDIVLDARDGRVAGIEVKASASIGPKDFRGLTFLRDALGERFVRGVLLYIGEHTLPFGDRLLAMPVDALWRLGATPHAEE